MVSPVSTPTTQRLVTHIPTSSTSSSGTHCTPFTLASHGQLALGPNSTITLTANAVFTPECAATKPFGSSAGTSSINDIKAAFSASVTPQVYATGAATVLSWMLVVMLLITPRTFFVGGVGGGVGLLGRRGMISGSQGGASVIGVGSRPWLQKAAALTVAVSLTIATADTFDVAERQYLNGGFMNADALRVEVVNSTSIKVSRLISDIFLWLAQVQTLIRLFPRHKEKVLIKWIGFALIVLDTTFSCLNSFTVAPTGRTQRFRDAIPALSYLFQLALSMLYACWVLYYAICKRRYAFYHSNMWNVSIVAFLSLIAIATPVVFFITDIANASVAGWGDYFRWVGAAAASVIVWEWVERIEALEREEKKDGILGREVFDGDGDDDEEHFLEQRRRRRRLWAGQRDNEGASYTSGMDSQNGANRSSRILFHTNVCQLGTPQRSETSGTLGESTSMATGRANHSTTFLAVPTPPPQVASPINRADTASASTVYTVRYNTINLATPPVSRALAQAQRPSTVRPPAITAQDISTQDMNEKEIEFNSDSAPTDTPTTSSSPPPTDPPADLSRSKWTNPFKRRKVLPPAEVRQGHVIDPVSINSPPPTERHPAHSYATWDIKGRLGAFAAEKGERFLERTKRQTREDELPVTIIPAQSRRIGPNGTRIPNTEPHSRPWSPDMPGYTPDYTPGLTVGDQLSPSSQARLLGGTSSVGEAMSPTRSDTVEAPGSREGERPARRDQVHRDADGRPRAFTITIEDHDETASHAR
ncbi:PalH-domain-containing protein [Microthyrium microscopicum]|uniref:PalH-domain-containing protein n=1 Tax=Microthyrium microscopicum TaxID=703497 RepID=A0A6A6TWY4_9PEZI|nr:PalH-domain-containing protein [Microthyrium microscopicum]